jgi:DNA-binding MarR family transcriptional regulator
MAAALDLRNLDELVHAPARLAIMAILIQQDRADFTWLARQLNLTGGNLTTHLRKLEDAGYVRCRKGFVGRKPRTTYRMLPKGREAFERYLRELEKLTLGRVRQE